MAKLLTVDEHALPASSDEAADHIASFTSDIVNEALTVRALADTLKGAKKFIEQAAREYAERFLFELIQNAYDAQPAGTLGRVLVIFDASEGEFGCVYVANTGTPFTADNFRAICEIAQSSKQPGEGIGNKGVGFKSVLQIAAWPEIYSNSATGGRFDGYCFGFADPDAIRRLTSSSEEAATLADRISPYGLPIHIPPDQVPDRLHPLAAVGYASVVRLPLRTSTAANIVREQIAEVISAPAPILLFLDRLESLDVQVIEADGSRTDSHLMRHEEPLELAASDVQASIIDLGGAERFLCLTRRIEHDAFVAAIEDSISATLVDESWRDWHGDASVSIALKLDDVATPDNRLYCFLPMGSSAPGPLAGHINAPFAVSLARDGLVKGAPLNAFLLDAAADVVAAAAIPLREHPDGPTLVVDLIAWDPEHASRLVDAFSRAGRSFKSEAVLPILGDKRWSSLAAAHDWRRSLRTLTAEAIAGDADGSIVDPTLGSDRCQRLDSLARVVASRGLPPSLARVADWAEKVAVAIAHAARRRGASVVGESWIGLYDDLAEIFGRDDVEPLRGRQLLIDDDVRLHRTWGATEAGKETAIFFPMREIQDGDDATRDVSIPKTLGRHLAYLHAGIPWRSLNESTRRLENRPGREFLERSGLVRMPRTQSIFERLASVLARSRDKQVHADALRLAYNLTAGRSYAQTPGVHQLHLRVPTADGAWRPANEAIFSSAWPGTQGETVERLIEEAAGVSGDLIDVSTRLLAAPAAFGFRVEPLHAWIAFLRRVGVGDGLCPIDVTPKVGDQQGWWWTASFPATVALPDADHQRWDKLVSDATRRPNHPYTDYRLTGPVVRLPGAAEYADFPQRARETYGRLITAGLSAWDDAVLSVTIARPRSQSQADAVSLPSPVLAFLRLEPWLPVTRPGSAGEEDFVRPSGAWHYRESDSEARPTFMPLVVTSIRRELDADGAALGRLRMMGLSVWSERAHALRRLRSLATAYARGDVADTLVTNFRKAYERTWTLVTRGAGTEPAGALKGEDLIVVTVRGRLVTQSIGSDQVPYVLVDEDRLVSAVLDSLEVPVLRADPLDGRAAAVSIEQSTGVRLRPVGGEDVMVSVDGESVGDRDGEPLIAAGREWLTEVVALTLELKASAFNRQTDQRIRAALETLRAIQLHAGASVSISLHGELVALPAHLRRVFAIDAPARPGVAYVGDQTLFDWDTFVLLAPKIGELLGPVETANALESVATALARRLGGGSTTGPTDDDYSAVFEESVDHIRELRRAQRSGVTGLAFVLRPVVAALTGEDVIGSLLEGGAEDPDADAILGVLRGFDDRLSVAGGAAALVEAASAGATLAALREQAGIGFADFNRVLRAIGGSYEPLTNPQGLVVALATHLALHRGTTVERIRQWALPGFDRGEEPTVYARLIADLDAAMLRRNRIPVEWRGHLDPDPAWLEEYESPPPEALEDRVNRWLEACEVFPASGRVDLLPLGDVQTANRKSVSQFAERAMALLPVWSAKRGGVLPPEWVRTGASDEIAGELTTRKILDFRPLDDQEIVVWLERLGRWSPELPRSLSFGELGLTEADISAQRDAAERAKWERAQARRSVPLDGTPVSLETDRIETLISAFRDGLSEDVLATAERPVSLDTLEERRRRKKPKEGERPPKPKRKVPDRMTSDQTELVGFMGELTVFEWLRRKHGDAALWRSHYRRHVLADGDLGNDDLGFDFEVLRTSRPPLMYEVKATTGDDLAFEMSEAEIRVAQEHAGNDRYRVVFVPRVNDSERRELIVLPNPLSALGRGRYRIVGRGIRYEFELPDKR